MKRGLSQEEFAARTGYSRSYVSQVENGHYSASLDAIIAFANVLKVVPADLLKDILWAYFPPGANLSPHAGHSIFSKSMRRTSAGEILFPHFGQTASRDAFTFSMFIFRDLGTRPLWTENFSLAVACWLAFETSRVSTGPPTEFTVLTSSGGFGDAPHLTTDATQQCHRLLGIHHEHKLIPNAWVL
jgi:transcriptional regulator with XRE-family HTH domain